MPAQAGPAVGGRSWDLDATIERPEGAGGVLFATGTANSGFVVFVQNDRLVFEYNYFTERTVVESEQPVPVGSSVVGVRFRRTKGTATVTLVIDGAECGSGTLDKVMRIISSIGSSVACDHGSQVSTRYSGPFPFEGDLVRLDIQVVEHRRAEAGEAAVAAEREAMGKQ